VTSPYGPSGRFVERFLDRLAQFRLEDFEAVVRRWRVTLRDSDAWYAAEDAVGDAVARTRRDGVMWTVQDRIYEVFRGSTWYEQRPPGTPVAPSEMAAQYLATTAVVALLVADVLPGAALGVLYAPFRDAIPLAELALGGTVALEPGVADRPAGEQAREDLDGRAWH